MAERGVHETHHRDSLPRTPANNGGFRRPEVAKLVVKASKHARGPNTRPGDYGGLFCVRLWVRRTLDRRRQFFLGRRLFCRCFGAQETNAEADSRFWQVGILLCIGAYATSKVFIYRELSCPRIGLEASGPVMEKSLPDLG